MYLQDDKAQENLRLAAEHLRSVVNAAATSPLKKKVIKKLQVAAKQVAAVSTQLIAASQGTAASNRLTSIPMHNLNNHVCSPLRVCGFVYSVISLKYM